jgi:hypothetical protein
LEADMKNRSQTLGVFGFAAFLVAVVGCSSSSTPGTGHTSGGSAPGQTSAGSAPGQTATASTTERSSTASTGGGKCSNPNPDPMSLTFAGVVCVLSSTSVAQSDGSVELKVKISVENKDPNTFGVRTWDFEVLDSAGHDVDADDAKSAQRTGGAECVYQDLSDDGWPLDPGKTFSLPGPVCFNLESGERPTQLVWQGDVSVSLS